MLRAHVVRSIALSSFLTTILAASAARAQDLPPPPPPPPPSDAPPPPPASVPPPASKPAPSGNAGPSRPAPSSAADLPPADEPTPARFRPMLRAGAGVEVYWWSAKDFGSTFPVIPYGIFELSRNVLLDVHVPLSLASNIRIGSTTSKAGAGLGNPNVGVTYVSTEGRTSWSFGGRIGLPLAGLGDSEPWQAANALAAFSMALWDLHYWAYKYVPIGLRLGVEHMATPKLFLRGGLEPTLFVPVDSKNAQVATSQKTLFLYQLRLEIEGRSDSGWGGGLGLQLVHVLSESNAFGDKDNAQGAIEPFVSYDSVTTFARLGILVAMDPPLGAGFDKDKVAALRLNVGSHF